MEILKGAAAATLYGTEASNGVIQIFTKRGIAGPPKWDLTVGQDFSNYPTNRIDDNWGVPTRQGQVDSLKKLWARQRHRALHALQRAAAKPVLRDGICPDGKRSVTGGTKNSTTWYRGTT